MIIGCIIMIVYVLLWLIDKVEIPTCTVGSPNFNSFNFDLRV